MSCSRASHASPSRIAGVSKKNALNQPHGFRCESQGTLFFDVARIIAHHRPPFFLLENVKNLLNHDRGRTFRVIRNTLESDLGYRLHARVINARSWVPQHRERIFLVGFRDHTTFSFDDIAIPDPAEGPRLITILHPEDGSEVPEDGYTEGPRAKVASRYTLSQHLWTYLQAYAEKHRRRGNGFGFGLVGPDDVTRTLSARYYKDGSEILVRQRGKRPRRLTPRECARLMGFDRPDIPPFRIPVSDTQAYRQFGNAVAVPVAVAVARHMEPWDDHRATAPGSTLLTDIVDPATRSRMMSGIRGRDTKPELRVRKALHARGFRYRVHQTRLPGKPDIVLPCFRAVVLVHGCFWHGHDCPLFRLPGTRTDFWRDKIRTQPGEGIKASPSPSAMRDGDARPSGSVRFGVRNA